MKKFKINIMVIALMLFSLNVNIYAQDLLKASFDDPANPGLVKITWRNGDIEIIGHKSNEVTVDIEGSRRERSSRSTEGLKKIYDGDAVEVEKEGNDIYVSSFSMYKSVNAVIYVPENAEIEFVNELNGDVTVEKVKGVINATTLNGQIDLIDLVSPVNAHSTNGDIIAVFESINFTDLMSFSTINSAIDLTLPTDTKALFSLKTNDEIYSDFDIEREGRTSLRSRSRSTYYTINGGGELEIELSSLNGDFYIRKKK